MSAISGLISAGSAVFNGADDLKSIRSQGVINDQLLGYKAGLTNEQGSIAGAKSRAASGGVVAAQHQAYANAGVDAGTGTAAATQIATQGQGELDAQTIQNNAAREVWGYGVQQQENKMNTLTAAQTASKKAISGILTGVSTAAGGAIGGGGFGGGGS